MKVCANCLSENVGVRDIDTLCPACEAAETPAKLRRERAKQNRKARESALRSLGLVKVRGAMGGVYWE